MKISKITFTSGTLQQITAAYFNLNLMNKEGKIIYKATISHSLALQIAEKHSNIKMN